MKRKTNAANADHGSSAPFDLDRLIADDPKARQAARGAQIATAVGDMVRRARTTKRVSQPTLARRTGCTQAHISELERGLGPNGPTVATLGRIMDELGEEIVIETARERTARNAAQAAEAEAWLANLLKTSSVAADPETALSQLSAEIQEVNANSFRRMLVQGVLTGLQLGARLPARQVVELTDAAEATMPGTARYTPALYGTVPGIGRVLAAAAGPVGVAGAVAAGAVGAGAVMAAAGAASSTMKEEAAGQASSRSREHPQEAGHSGSESGAAETGAAADPYRGGGTDSSTMKEEAAGQASSGSREHTQEAGQSGREGGSTETGAAARER